MTEAMVHHSEEVKAAWIQSSQSYMQSRADCSEPKSMFAFSQLASSTSIPRTQPRKWCHLHFQWTFLSQLTQLRRSFTGMPAGQPNLNNSSLRLFPLVIPDCVRLTINITTPITTLNWQLTIRQPMEMSAEPGEEPTQTSSVSILPAKQILVIQISKRMDI